MDFTKMEESSTEVTNAAGVAETVETQPAETKTEEVKAETAETKVEEKVEAKVETKEEKVEGAVGEVKEEVKEAVPRTSFFEKKEVKEEVKVEPTEREKQLEAELTQFREKQKVYDETPAGVLIKAQAGDIDLRNVDVKALLKEAVGEDFTKYPLSELMKMDIQKQYPHLSEEDAVAAAEVEMAKLEDWQKKALPATLAAKLSAAHKPHEIFAKLEAIKAEQLQASATYTEQARQNEINTAVQDITGTLSELGKTAVGQEMNGITLTAEILEEMKQAFVDQVTNPDAESHFMALFNQVTAPKIAEAVGKKEYERGLADGLKQKTNANAHVGAPGVIVSQENETGMRPGMTKEQLAAAQ
jgi:hypothetical protein